MWQPFDTAIRDSMKLLSKPSNFFQKMHDKDNNTVSPKANGGYYHFEHEWKDVAVDRGTG